MTFRVVLPDPPEFNTTLGGLTPATGPEGETDTEKVTVPEKPFRLVTVIVDVPDEPATILIDVGLADIVKSWDPMM